MALFKRSFDSLEDLWDGALQQVHGAVCPRPLVRGHDGGSAGVVGAWGSGAL